MAEVLLGDDAHRSIGDVLRSLCADKDYEAPFLKLKLIAQRLRVPGYSRTGMTRADLCDAIARHLNEAYGVDVDPAVVKQSVTAVPPSDDADQWPSDMFDPVTKEIIQHPVYVPFSNSPGGRVMERSTYEAIASTTDGFRNQDPVTRRPLNMDKAVAVPPFHRLENAFSVNKFGVPLSPFVNEDVGAAAGNHDEEGTNGALRRFPTEAERGAHLTRASAMPEAERRDYLARALATPVTWSWNPSHDGEGTNETLRRSSTATERRAELARAFLHPQQLNWNFNSSQPSFGDSASARSTNANAAAGTADVDQI